MYAFPIGISKDKAAKMKVTKLISKGAQAGKKKEKKKLFFQKKIKSRQKKKNL
jgi:hypothetical protein